MGDVAILIGKGGNVIDLGNNKTGTSTDTIDNEDGDDIDEDELSGSGSTGLPNTSTEPVFTTSPAIDKLSLPDDQISTTTIIIGMVVAVVVLVIIAILILLFCRRRRRKQREKYNNTKPLPHPSSMEMSEASRATLPVCPTGDGYYSTAVPLAALYPQAGDELPPPTEPPPPPPSTKKSPSQSKPASSARYTKMNPGGASAPAKEKSENIYETIDDYAVGGAPANDDSEVYLMAASMKGEDDEEGGDNETDKFKC